LIAHIGLDDAQVVEYYRTGRPDGFLGLPPDQLAPTAWMPEYVALHRQLAEENFVDRAVSILKRAGYHAWKNPVGHLGVEPTSM